MKRIAIYFVLTLLILQGAFSQISDPVTFQNPILPGSYPDPSVCRVGEWYYMVNSSFLWWPGVPIHRSKDLVNWEHLGYVLSTKEHLNITDYPGDCAGPWAPTIRYNEGMFYVTVTLRSTGGDIVTTATNPAGPWTIPKKLNLGGIDGSLFFDDDNKTWYCWSDDKKIHLTEFNKNTLKPVGEKFLLLDEQTNAQGYTYIEGPHIYKVNGRYILLIANGGTNGNKHSISLFRSNTITGPYTEYANNPVLNHKIYPESPFIATGHADVVQTQNGDWWAVLLAKRHDDGINIRDRETFLTPVTLEGGWFVFNPNANGEVLQEDIRPNLPWTPMPQIPDKDEFNDNKLNFGWVHHRTPHDNLWSTTERNGYLRINLLSGNINERLNNPTVVRRITQGKFTATTKLDFTPQTSNEVAGLVAMANNQNSLAIQVGKSGSNNVIQLIKTEDGVQNVEASQIVSYSGIVYLQLVADGRYYSFYAGQSMNSLVQIGGVQDAEIISRKCFHGSCVGMYASSKGATSTNHADFDWFEYKIGSGASQSQPVPSKIEAENYCAQSGVQTENCSEGGLNVGWIGTGDWMDYCVDVENSGEYTVEFRVAAKTSNIKLDLKQGSTVLCSVDEPATGGWQTWATVSKTINLSAGEQTLRILATGGGWNINWINISKDNSAPVDYTIQSEDYSAMFGINVETTADIGGGQNIGWIQNNDWSEYSVDVPSAGTYSFTLRAATAKAGGDVVLSKGGTTLGTVAIEDSKSNGWQDWYTTDPISINLEEGNQTIRLTYTGGSGFLYNLNWLNIYTPGLKSINEVISGLNKNQSVSIHPNPAFEEFTVSMVDYEDASISIFNMYGQLIKRVSNSGNMQHFSTNNMQKGTYLIVVTDKNNINTSKLLIK